jgi:hypothetical protein
MFEWVERAGISHQGPAPRVTSALMRPESKRPATKTSLDPTAKARQTTPHHTTEGRPMGGPHTFGGSAPPTNHRVGAGKVVMRKTTAMEPSPLVSTAAEKPPDQFGFVQRGNRHQGSTQRFLALSATHRGWSPTGSCSAASTCDLKPSKSRKATYNSL